LDGNSDGYSPSVCAGHDDADAEIGDVPAQPVADQQQLVLADPKPEVDDDMPLAALLQVSCEQPEALLNDNDVVMSPGPHDPSSSSSSSSSSLDDLQPPVEEDAKADADPGPPPPAVPVADDRRPAPQSRLKLVCVRVQKLLLPGPTHYILQQPHVIMSSSGRM
jgi:hypothetical protein